jgi:UDP-3-O-[3-hydroxymyristoyl] glucosamine N-acyltransferase
MSISSLNLSDVADVISGEVLRDAAFSNMGFAIHLGPGLLTWLERRKYLPDILKNSGISAVIAPPELADLIPDELGILSHSRPRDAFYQLHNHLAKTTSFYGEASGTIIHPTAIVDPDSHVAKNGVIIGEGVIIEPGANILTGTSIGVGSIIRSGVVLGSQGLQFSRMDDKWVSIEHVGGVEIGEDVEIQSNSNVCRAIFRGRTSIGDNTKIDALVHVAHNVKIGRSNMICAGASICGSTVVGDGVYIGPGAVILNCIEIGNEARITMGAVVVHSLRDKSHVTGNWALPHDRHMQSYLDNMR